MVWHMGLFPHLAADAMPTIFADHSVACPGDHRFHRLANRSQPVSASRGGNPGIERAFCEVEQCLSDGIDRADSIRPCRIRVEPVNSSANINRGNVPVTQDALARNAMHDLIVDRRANSPGEAQMAEERGMGAFVADDLASHVVQVTRGYPWRNGPLDCHVD